MTEKQTFNLSPDFLEGFPSTFMNLVLFIIGIYTIFMVLNFLRDKFINKEVNSKNDDIIDLLTILNKLFYWSGFGFIIANIIEVVFSQFSDERGLSSIHFRGEWENLTFGIIILFVGIGFKVAKKIIVKNRIDLQQEER